MDAVLDELEECVSGKDDIERQGDERTDRGDQLSFCRSCRRKNDACCPLLEVLVWSNIGEIAGSWGKGENYISVSLNRIRGKLHTLDGKGVRSMKKEELFETMGNLDPGMVEKAGKYQRSRRAAENGRPRSPVR